MPLTITIPQVGLANQSEEPKIANDLTNLAAWANGNITDTDLRSANNTVRRLLLQATAQADDATGAGDRIFTFDGNLLASGAAAYSPPPLWIGDAGVSSQPLDFQVPNKTAVARLRVALLLNAAVPIAVTFGLYTITGVGGFERSVSYTFATPFGGATVQIISPPAGITNLESGEFSLPLAAGPYALGVNLSPALPAGAAAAMTAQLMAYNV